MRAESLLFDFPWGYQLINRILKALHTRHVAIHQALPGTFPTPESEANTKNIIVRELRIRAPSVIRDLPDNPEGSSVVDTNIDG